MPDQSLIDILEQCLRMEGIAIKVYSQLAGQTTEALQSFWSDMEEQEKEHAQYWKLLIQLAHENKIRNVFDHPLRILRELEEALEAAVRLSDQVEFDNIEHMFLAAYHLEFILLHPAFQALFIFMRNVTGDRSPGDKYHDHIQGLIKACRKFVDIQSPSFELIANMSEKLLQRNEMIAAQLAELRQIRGLLPICMHCKNVRKDDGFWVKVEEYIEERSEAEFSHGICPACMKKHYGDYFTDEELNES
ncbi:hypothetical protein ACFL4L_01235 [bacterium]